ncbi:hypothetical protein EHQ53_14250 [Leptospira langatensis]|uniref:Peptidase C39-like domain-containing protein n=1 Tax=Leptospira langatensis TaxID=2484983 RepID=A0ABY2MCD1_9LEPT|nr:hypothetical protein [Leptospira langatensis]TGL39679.1 hypothetical protein EHQ53_14250 [Leptospira langatensis]
MTEKIPGSSDCGYSSFCEMASFFDKSYGTIQKVQEVIANLEPYEGPEGFGNYLVKTFAWAKKIFSEHHRIGSDLRAYAELARNLFPKLTIIHADGGTWDQFDSILEEGFPIMIFTMLAGTGHFVCVEKKDSSFYTVQDPWGDAMVGYANHDGSNAKYPIAFLKSKVGPKPYFVAMKN